jgi:hypothetical protein
VAERQTRARLAGDRRGRLAGAVVALAAALAALGACASDGGGTIPPVPSQLRTLEQREAGCIACHDGRRAPKLAPGVDATPAGHPPIAVVRYLRATRTARR